MRYMRWSYPELLACPVDYIGLIVDESKREAREIENARRSR